jgi:putative peptide zinc metalloprotease protein
VGAAVRLALVRLSQMSVGLYSSSWYRVAALRPRLRAHVAIHRQRFRGETWYVVQDHQVGRFHRLSPAAHHAVSLMDGRRTVQRIWEIVSDRLGEDQPTQEDMVRLLALLHGGDLLVGELPPDMDELAQRSQTIARSALLLKLRNPLALRLPLLDPDRFLSATMPLTRPLFSILGLLAWLALVLAGLALTVIHWPALSDNVADQAFSAHNLLLLLAVYPVLKTLHELGHAYATKAWGGEVHEMGLMLLVLVPVLYVDASASTAFREKWRRALVGGAGIMVEMALAAGAIILWVHAEPGLVRALAFNVALIGGVSTLLFNGNPLLRFDGYYVLSDLIEIPNLASRGNKYLFHLLRRHAFGLREEAPPALSRGEAGWLVSYALAAFLYRLSMILGIALFIATKMFFLGIALAIAALAGALVWPALTGIKYVLFNPQLARHRKRAVAVSAAAVAAVLALVFAAPVPYATIGEGIIWVGDQATVRALGDGVIGAIEVSNGATVAADTVLVTLQDPVLSAEHEVLQRQLDELELRLAAVKIDDAVAANLLREQIRHTEGRLAQNARQLAELVVKADRAGRFFVSDADDLPGRFLRRGDVVGYLLTDDEPIIRAVVPQTDADLVRRRTGRIEIRLADRVDRAMPAELLREVPAAIAEIPHLALSTAGGGAVVLDPAHTDKPQPLETLFHFDLRSPQLPARLGERVFVRFDHGSEPIALRIGRGIRQLFLRQFSV